MRSNDSLRRHFCFGLVLALALASVPSAHAQVASRLPNPRYYALFFEYNQADYPAALKDFSSGANGAFKVGTTRFLDSSCYWTMMGECHYHMGNYGDAVSLYEQALDLYLFYAAGNWQSRVQQPNIQASTTAVQRAQITWYTPQRVGAVAQLPDTFQMLFGRLDAERAFFEGGVVQNAEIKLIDVVEITRCIGLALHRRRMIKGAIGKHDPFTSTLITGLSSLPQDGSLLGRCNTLLLGLAYANALDYERAKPLIERGLQLPGGMDHHLTPVGLLTLAYIALEEGDLNRANTMALEASFAAAVRGQIDLVEESLSLGTIVHLQQSRTPYPPLEPAIGWANRREARMMQASLLVRLAECFTEAGDADSSEVLLRDARRPMSRTSLARSMIGTRATYVHAANQFLTGNSDGGAKSLADAMKGLQNGSRWLYRLGLADSLVVAGNVGEREADLLYEALLSEPTSAAWKTEPMESIAFLLSPHVAPLERWFEVVMARRNFQRAIEISEMIRRHRFYSALPMGGRLLGLRWMLHGPDEALTETALQQRVDFLTRYPAYKQWMDQSTTIRNELLKLPLVPPPDTDEAKKQKDLFVQMFQLANTQESFLSSMALRREPAELMFPPQRDFEELQNRIGQGQLVYVVLLGPNGYHRFALTRGAQRYLGVASKRDVEKSLVGLFRAMEMQDPNGSMDAQVLVDDSWKAASNETYQLLFPDVGLDAWDSINEVIVVPDGVLWYLPFEILHAGDAPDNLQMLADQARFRYAPTLALGLAPQRPDKRIVRALAIRSSLHPRADATLAEQAVAQLRQTIPDLAEIADRMSIPSHLYSAVADLMIVWADLKTPSRGGVFGLNPGVLDQGRAGSTLGAWLSLPFEGPEYLIVPGYSSGGAAGSRMKGDGSDLFFGTTAFLASGCRTVLLSRWRTGGKTSLDLTRSFAQRLRTQRPLDAWWDSVDEIREQVIDQALEPRLKPDKDIPELTADHPFFWAGLMLIEVPNEKTAIDPSSQPDLPGSGEKLPGDGDDGDADADADGDDGDDDGGDGPEMDGAQPAVPPQADGGEKKEESKGGDGDSKSGGAVQPGDSQPESESESESGTESESDSKKKSDPQSGSPAAGGNKGESPDNRGGGSDKSEGVTEPSKRERKDDGTSGDPTD